MSLGQDGYGDHRDDVGVVAKTNANLVNRCWISGLEWARGV